MGLRDLFRKKRTPPPETSSPTAEPQVADDGDVTEHLDFLLRGHGVVTERHGPTLVVPGTPYRAEAEVVTDRSMPRLIRSSWTFGFSFPLTGV